MLSQSGAGLLIVALNRAGVIPVEEGQDVGRVLREDRLTTTWCKLEIKRAGRLYVGGCEVGRVGIKPEDIRSVWKVLKDGGRLGGLRDDSEGSGTTRKARGYSVSTRKARGLGGARWKLGGLWVTR